MVERDLEGALDDRFGLADELVHPLLANGAEAVGVGVDPVRGAGRPAVEERPEWRVRASVPS